MSLTQQSTSLRISQVAIEAWALEAGLLGVEELQTSMRGLGLEGLGICSTGQQILVHLSSFLLFLWEPFLLLASQVLGLCLFLAEQQMGCSN
jgi:hypothetical protein